MTLPFSPLQANVMNHMQYTCKESRSKDGSEARAEVDRQMDGHNLSHYLPY